VSPGRSQTGLVVGRYAASVFSMTSKSSTEMTAATPLEHAAPGEEIADTLMRNDCASEMRIKIKVHMLLTQLRTQL
jgi:hypothetical protein